MLKLKRSLILLFAIAVMISIGFAPSVQAAQKLRVVAPFAVKGWEPVSAGFLFSRMNCLERLATVDENGKITGQLAESWTVGPDKLTWTFTLRSGVKFHDGTLMTAKHVAHNLNRLLEKKGILAGVPIEYVKAQGDQQVVIKTQKPFSPLTAYLCHYSSGILAPASYDAKGDAFTVVGTGPYRLVSHQGDKLYEFEAFQDYWGGKASIPLASYHAVPQGDARSNMVRAGQAEMSFTLSPTGAQKIAQSGQAKVVAMTIPRTRLISFNCTLPMFADPRVRQALSLAIDRKGIAGAILRNPQVAASQLLAPGLGSWHDPSMPPLGFDPQKAADLLDQAGWKPGPDGVRIKDGQPFQFELLTYSSRPMLPLLATALQDQWARLGIKATISVGESGNIVDRHKDGTLQAALVARNFGMIPEPVGNLASDFAMGGNWGPLGWKSPELNKLIQSYFETFQEDQKQKLCSGILSILQNELPVIPVSWYENIVAYHKELQDVRVDPLEIEYHLDRIRWAQ